MMGIMGGGMDQESGGAMGVAPGAGGGGQMAQIQARYAALSPQEKQIVNQLFTPQFASVLVKLIPELAPVLGPFIQGAGGGAGAQPGATPTPVPTPIPRPQGGRPMMGSGQPPGMMNRPRPAGLQGIYAGRR